MAAADATLPVEQLARDAKKRKNDEPSDLPSSSSSSLTASSTTRGAVQCAYCGFAAADLEQSLTHLREQHGSDVNDNSASNNREPASTPRAVDQATRVGQLLVAHALQNLPTSSGNTNGNAAVLEDARVQYERIVAFFASLQERDAGAALESLRLLFQDNLSMMSTLQDASRMALEQAQCKQKQAQHEQEPVTVQVPMQLEQPARAKQTSNNQQDVEMRESPPALTLSLAAVTSDSTSSASSDENGDSDTGRASIHEEQAAQALTGLRALTPRVGAEQEKKLQNMSAAQLFASQLSTAASAPPSHQQPVSHSTSSSRNAAYPSAGGFQTSFSARSPLSITAPQTPSLPGMGSPLFHASERFKAGGGGGGATPSGSLPSIFSRPLLAPLSSPLGHETPSSSGLFAQHRLPTPSNRAMNGQPPHPLASISDWKSAAPSSSDAASAGIALGALNPKLEPTSVTPVTAAGYYRGLTQGSGQTSPVKRKSITSKQLMATPHASAAAAGPLGLPPSTAYALIERSHPVRKANPRRWTKDEDEALRQAVESHREKNWKAIAAEVPGRNHTQCLQRWTKVLAPGLVKGHWSPQEDDLLRRLVASEQKNWGEVAAKIPGRTSKQCRERWHNHLDPNIVRGAYTPEEDRIILEAQARLGNRWSVIAAMLPGRTEDAVKIRWKSHCRVWRARKYLRKSAADTPGGGGGGGRERMDDDDGDDGEESSDTESLSGMETPLAMTPMTPGYGHAFAWPTAPGGVATPRSRSSSSSTGSGGSSQQQQQDASESTDNAASDGASRVGCSRRQEHELLPASKRV